MSAPPDENNPLSLTHNPMVLHAASIERMEEAEELHNNGRWVLCMYAAGVAVEALLQAIALRAGEPHDARHDLRKWLNKCPAMVVDAIKARARDPWSLLNEMWDNDLRYLSDAGLLGRLRSRKQHGRISGGPEAIRRTCARRCLDAARAVHNKGLIAWSAVSSES